MWRRAFAQLVDAIIVSAIVTGVAFGTKTFTVDNGTFHTHVHLGDRALYLGIALLYFFLFEWVLAATIGKLICGVRVVRKNGGRVGFGGAFVRTILRVIDQLPAFYIVGWISAMVTGNDDRARLGDLAGHTRVVRSTAVAAYAAQPQYQAAPVQPG